MACSVIYGRVVRSCSALSRVHGLLCSLRWCGKIMPGEIVRSAMLDCFGLLPFWNSQKRPSPSIPSLMMLTDQFSAHLKIHTEIFGQVQLSLRTQKNKLVLIRYRTAKTRKSTTNFNISKTRIIHKRCSICHDSHNLTYLFFLQINKVTFVCVALLQTHL